IPLLKSYPTLLEGGNQELKGDQQWPSQRSKRYSAGFQAAETAARTGRTQTQSARPLAFPCRLRSQSAGKTSSVTPSKKPPGQSTSPSTGRRLPPCNICLLRAR